MIERMLEARLEEEMIAAEEAADWCLEENLGDFEVEVDPTK